MKSNAKQILALVEEFNDTYRKMDCCDEDVHNKNLSNEEREEAEMDYYIEEGHCYEIAEKIKALNPSKYMMDKYSDLEFILSNFG